MTYKSPRIKPQSTEITLQFLNGVIDEKLKREAWREELCLCVQKFLLNHQHVSFLLDVIQMKIKKIQIQLLTVCVLAGRISATPSHPSPGLGAHKDHRTRNGTNSGSTAVCHHSTSHLTFHSFPQIFPTLRKTFTCSSSLRNSLQRDIQCHTRCMTFCFLSRTSFRSSLILCCLLQ